MSYEVPGQSTTLTAGADFTGSHHRFCNMSADGTAVNPSAGGRVYGVRQDSAESGRGVAVMSTGISRVEAGAAVDAGDSVETDATGRAVPLASGTAVGIAETPAAGAGTFISVRLTPVA